MNCRSFAKLANEYCDGTLPEPEVEELQKHAAVCRGCQRLRSELESLSFMAKELARVKAPEDFEAGLFKKIRSSEREKQRAPFIWRYVHPIKAGVYAMVLVLVLGGLLRWQEFKPSQPPAISNSHTLKNPPPPDNKPADPSDKSEYVEVLLEETGDQDVVLRLPKTIRIDSPLDNDYYMKNISY